jgi:uncharacterized protein (DUF1015 family)
MARIRAFNGYRYRLNAPDDLNLYAAPPYDMVDDAMVDRLYAKSAFNTIRIIQNKPEPGDAANRDRHRRAATLLNGWINDKRIAADAAPSMYGYRHSFTINGVAYARTGVIALVELVDYAAGVVQPHEFTLSGPKVDRAELLAELNIDTGLIFGLVPDDGAFHGAINSAIAAPAQGAFTDADNVRHELFPITDPAAIARLRELMADRTILIADGHHRYETHLKYYRENNAPERAFVMMSLVSMADPGLVIRPFHRLVKKHARSAALASAADLSAFFDLSDAGGSGIETIHSYLGGAGAWDMLFYDRDTAKLWGLTVNSAGRAYLSSNGAGMSPQWNGLNVSIINRLCVEAIMRQPLDGTVLHDVMDYVNDADTAFRKVVDGAQYRGAFFIRPIDIQTVREIVSRTERMPQKSTNFFPKLYSGLVFNSLAPQ